MAMATKKTTTARKKSTGTHSTLSLLKSLPESIENLEIVKQAASVLGELQGRVIDVKEEASRELHKVMKRYEKSCKELEKKLSKVTHDAKKQAQISMISIMQKWHEHKEKLPSPVAKEIEKVIAQIGTKVMEKTQKKTAKKPAAKSNAKAKKAKAVKKTRAKKTAKAQAKHKTPEAAETLTNVL
jgi:hypothetical protein